MRATGIAAVRRDGSRLRRVGDRNGGRRRPAQKPAFQRAPDALERVTWRTRTLVGDDRLTNWDFAIATQTLPGLTFLEGVVRAEAAVVDFVEGADTQTVSADLQKRFDSTLTAAETRGPQDPHGSGAAAQLPRRARSRPIRPVCAGCSSSRRT